MNYKNTLNNLKKIETFDIKILSNDIKCINCNKHFLDNSGKYYCYWCNCFFCIECTEKRMLSKENNLEI